MADTGRETRAGAIEGRASSDAPACEVNHVGSVLCRCGDRFLRPDVGLYKSRGPSLRRIEMEYLIAGITAVFLFVYLMYALLRPERF